MNFQSEIAASGQTLAALIDVLAFDRIALVRSDQRQVAFDLSNSRFQRRLDEMPPNFTWRIRLPRPKQLHSQIRSALYHEEPPSRGHMDLELRLRYALTVRIAKADLLSADAAFVDNASLPSWLAALKLSFVALANLAELEKATGILYHENPDLADHFKKIARGVIFAKYLRNIFIGHHNEQLLDKALEWKPELRIFVASEKQVAELIELFVLETAINTYVADDGSHRLFDSDTDLMYPPNIRRFNHFLEETIRGAFPYLDTLADVLLKDYQAPTFMDIMPLAVKAAATNFGFVTKGKR